MNQKHEQINSDGKAFNGNYGAVLITVAIAATFGGWAIFKILAGIVEAAF